MSEASGHRITAAVSLCRRGRSREERQGQNGCTLHAWGWSTMFWRQAFSRRGIRVNYIPGLRLQKHKGNAFQRATIGARWSDFRSFI